MVLDSSVLLAILQREPERELFLSQIDSAPRRLISAATVIEASIVVLSRRHEAGLADLQNLLARLEAEIVPLPVSQVDLAIEGFARFGKGRHPAGLNFGDCFSYALAKASGEPLLFKGDDFSKTDIEPAA
jgi:ribonuclease VapC